VILNGGRRENPEIGSRADFRRRQLILVPQERACGNARPLDWRRENLGSGNRGNRRQERGSGKTRCSGHQETATGSHFDCCGGLQASRNDSANRPMRQTGIFRNCETGATRRVKRILVRT